MINYFVAVSIGAFMGLLTHAKRNKGIIKPRNLKRTINPGFLQDMAFGAVAALIAVIVADPSGMERVILTSVLAGYSGEGFITKMESQTQQENIDNVKKRLKEYNGEVPEQPDKKNQN